MQGYSGESSEGPKRFSFIDPKQKRLEEEKNNFYRNRNNHNKANTTELNLESVWSIEKNVKVQSPLANNPLNRYHHSRSQTTPGAAVGSHNFYSRYSQNSSKGSTLAPPDRSNRLSPSGTRSLSHSRHGSSESANLNLRTGSGSIHSVGSANSRENQNSPSRRPPPGDPLDFDNF